MLICSELHAYTLVSGQSGRDDNDKNLSEFGVITDDAEARAKEEEDHHAPRWRNLVGLVVEEAADWASALVVVVAVVLIEPFNCPRLRLALNDRCPHRSSFSLASQQTSVNSSRETY